MDDSFAKPDNAWEWKALCDRIDSRMEAAIRNRLAEGETPITHCRRLFGIGCPGTWQALVSTEKEKVRFCSTCRHKVHLVAFTHEAARHEGECVTVVFPEVQFDYQPPPQDLLLRGSSGPDASSQELLRAAEEKGDVPSRQLLRATSEEGNDAIEEVR
jgi:hypothetical protein